MTPPRQRRPGISPGPSWAVLSEPASSSPSARTDLDVDMGDNESEHDYGDQPRVSIISKRKAPADTSPTAPRRPHKVPRLDLSGDPSIASSSSSTTPAIRNGARTQPASSSTQKNPKTPFNLDRAGAHRTPSTSSGTSTSDFPRMLSQMVHKTNMRDRERESEKQKAQGQRQGGVAPRQGPSAPARKQPAPTRKVTTSSLLKTTQSSTRDDSAPWTRIRPRLKQKRTNYNEEMARTRPLDVARNRGGDMIELTDSSDSQRRRPGPSQPSVAANKDDPIIITSGSEDDLGAIRPTQRRKSGTQDRTANRTRAPPPTDVEVISIPDSDEDLDVRGAVVASTTQINPPPPSRAPAAPRAPEPAPAPAAVPASTSASTSTRVPPSRPQNTQQDDDPSSFAPPHDDLEDPFSNMDFDTAGDDADPSDALDGWDNLHIGPPLATLPDPIPSRPAVVATNEPEREEAMDELFDSYVNMDQVGESEDRAAPSGAEDRTMEGEAAGSVKVTGNKARPNDADGDAHIQSLEDGELDPNDAPPRSAISRATPEDGEIRSQEVSAPKESQPLPSVVLPPRVATQPSTALFLFSSASASPRSSVSGASATQPPDRTNALVMPDISLYKGVRFKRPIDARENPFFSRALNGASQSSRERERSGSGSMDTPSRAGEVRHQGANTDMEVDTLPAPSRASDEAAAPSPPALPQQSEQVPAVPDTRNTSTTAPVLATPTIASNATTINDAPPPSTQPTPSSTPATPSHPPAATQPLSSRPFIAPPRVPRPNTPMSLAEVLNDLRSQQLQTAKQELELARKPRTPRTSLDEGAAPRADETGGAAAELGTPIQTTKPVERTPSLNDLRALLARRHAGTTSPSARAAQHAPLTPTPAARDRPTLQAPPLPVAVTTTHVVPASATKPNDGPKLQASIFPVAVPIPTPAPMPTTQVRDRPTPHVPTLLAAGPPSTPTPTTHVLPASTIKPKDRPRSYTPTLPIAVPLPSPMSTTQVKDKPTPHTPILPAMAPTSTPAPTTHVLPASTIKPKDKPTQHAQTLPVAVPVPAPIPTIKPRDRPRPHTPTLPIAVPTPAPMSTTQVKDKPTTRAPTLPATAPTSTPAPTIKPKDRPTHDAPTLPVSVPTSAPMPTHDAKDRPAMAKPRPSSSSPLDVAGSTPTPTTGSTSSSSGSSSRRPLPLPLTAFISPAHTRTPARTGRGDPDDPSLSPTAGCRRGQRRAPRASDAALFEMRIVRHGLGRQQPQPALSSSMASHGALESGPTAEAEGRGAAGVAESGESRPDVQAVDDADTLLELASVHLSQPEEVEDSAMDESPDPVATRRVDEPEREAMEVDPVTQEVIEISSRATTPELVLPEDDIDTVPAVDHTRHCSGGGDSVEECDVLLAPSAEAESESEGVSVGALVRPGTGSSASPSRVTSSVDPLDILRRPTPARSPSANDTQRHRVVTWKSYVAEQRARRPEYKLARQLPHSLQDHMNSRPASFRQSEVARRIFEAHIQEATANEPEAPLIEIFDNEIGDEVTPHWEFHYTNEMWHGEGVPPPDVANLESCGCVGRCDPKSRTCACAQRQQRWVQAYMDKDIIPTTWSGSPFVYDHKGVLQRLECPIFECNRFCHCDEDCSNRVVQNGRKYPVHIVQTKHKGVSAGNKKIPKGSYIGIYAGELLTEQEGEERGRYYDLYGRTYLFSIDFYHLRLGLEQEDAWDNLYVVDAYHAGNFTRFLNHSCDPNCKILACHIDDADVNKPLLAVFTTRDVEPWEELCFSYYGDIDEKLEEIEARREEVCVRDQAVYSRCRCEAENCIGRLFG